MRKSRKLKCLGTAGTDRRRRTSPLPAAGNDDVQQSDIAYRVANYVGSDKTETLGHVLGFYRKTELLRNNRHHRARTMLADILRQQGLEVHEEVHCISEDDSTRRADIIVIDRKKNTGTILDPTSDLINVCWTFTLREEHRLRVFENKVLRKIFGAKRDEVTGEWRKLHNTELEALYSSSDIIRNIKSKRLRWAGHVARMGESRNAYRVLVGRPEGKRPLERPRRRWEDNIKMDLREVGYDDRDWINLAQDRDRWRAYVRAAMNLRVCEEWLCFCRSVNCVISGASVQVEDLAENSSFACFKFQLGRWRGLCEENGGMYA
ncbi:hypothetical protein ANN_09744 [Periplaneta americana]|uniref:Uncharacterized protein n=1 Tax=Periplaneta americana TaxID=6978 RepID=A0ABQ8TP85_PERAM|nr:hypothetical protein ANN_09744 [Periplaneta americana]